MNVDDVAVRSALSYYYRGLGEFTW